VTNPIHGAYFAAEAVAEPFAYLAIEHGPLHWAAMGLAYALSFVGFFALFELFLRVNSDTRPLFALVGLTGLPVVLDVLGAVSPRLLNVTHSPLGVAAFAVGVLFVHLDRFRIARAAGEGDDPVIVLDDTDRVRDYNAGAVELLPSLAGRVGAAFDEVLPEIDAALEEPDPVVELDRDGTTRYYTISSGAFSMDRARTGRTIILTDVTDRERYRQRLERQNEQLERFASIVSHDLRNPLSVARGWTELAIEEEDTRELGNVVDAHNRMGEIIEEILTLAREGNPIDEREDVHLAAVADRSWAMTTSGDASLVVEDGGSFPIDADPERLQQLFENLFRNALEHGAADGDGGDGEGDSGDGADGGDSADGGDGADDLTVTVGVLPDRRGFFVEDDGVGIPPDAREAVFEPAYTTAADGTGFGLAIVGEIVEAHGWTIRVVEGRDGGARFEITLGGDDSGDRPDESDDPFDGAKA
jgi:signal transduction histidine kinase